MSSTEIDEVCSVHAVSLGLHPKPSALNPKLETCSLHAVPLGPRISFHDIHGYHVRTYILCLHVCSGQATGHWTQE